MKSRRIIGEFWGKSRRNLGDFLGTSGYLLIYLGTFELTIPWDTTNNMASALQRKTTRYENLVAEIQGNGFKCSNIPLEIGTRGVINSRNKAVLTQLCHWTKVTKVSQVTKTCSKLALLGSYTIWNARHSMDWSS